MRTEIKKFRQLLSEQKKDEARKLLQGVYAVSERLL